MKLIRRFTLIFVLLFLYILTSAFSYSTAVSNNLSNEVFRLHVIANSDSEYDQNLKYIVRDNLINYMNTIAKNANSKEDVIKIANEHTNEFKKIAEETVRNYGANYAVNVEIGNFYFPTKSYGDISLPCGDYDALKVEIGTASGKNWWCVMFPPLCFVDVSTGIVPEESKEYLKDNLQDEEFALISEDQRNIKFKFKIIEFFNKKS